MYGVHAVIIRIEMTVMRAKAAVRTSVTFRSSVMPNHIAPKPIA